MASQVRRSVASRRKIREKSAANSGAVATIISTLATPVFATAKTKPI